MILFGPEQCRDMATYLRRIYATRNASDGDVPGRHSDGIIRGQGVVQESVG